MLWAVYPISQGDTSPTLDDADFQKNSYFGISHLLPKILCWEGKIRTCALGPGGGGGGGLMSDTTMDAVPKRVGVGLIYDSAQGESIPKGLLPFPPNAMALQTDLAAGERSAEQDYIRLLAMQKNADGLKVFHFFKWSHMPESCSLRKKRSLWRASTAKVVSF